MSIEMSSSEQQEIESLYPAGSREREILNYSLLTHSATAPHPLLMAAFRILMSIAIAFAVSGIVFSAIWQS
jgi:hypothetical protein